MSSGTASTASGSVATRARETTAATAPRSTGRNDKVVAIVALAAHREEELARGHSARVNRVAANSQRAGIGHAGRRFQHRACADGRFCECEFHCSPP